MNVKKIVIEFNFIYNFQASDFSNVGEWPSLGKNEEVIKAESNSEVPKRAAPESPEVKLMAEIPAATSAPKPTTVMPQKQSQHPKPASQPSNLLKTITDKPSAAPENQTQQNGPVVNGHVASNNGGTNNTNVINNRRVSKHKWVPLEIDLPKSRSKPRERNNNVNTKRRDGDYDNDNYAERESRGSRYRATSYRSGGGSTTRPSNTNVSSRTGGTGAGRVNTTASGKRGPLRASGGGIQKTRHHRMGQSSEFSLDFPVDYSLVKKIVADGAAGIDAAPFLMPYMGTFYYNGVPSYANMDTSSLKEAIRKQV